MGTVVRLEKATLMKDGYEPPEGLVQLLKDRDLEAYLERPLHWHWRVETMKDGETVQAVGHCIESDDGTLVLSKQGDGPFCISNEYASLA
jgi:hypothetical protein